MKIYVKRDAFVSILNRIAYFSSIDDNLTIYRYIRLIAEQDSIALIAHNGCIVAREDITDRKIFRVVECGDVLLPSRKILEIFSLLESEADEEVVLKFLKGRLVVKDRHFSYRFDEISVLPERLPPPIPFCESSYFKLTTDAIRTLYNRTAHACSDIDLPDFNFQDIRLVFDKDSCTAVATDMRRIVTQRVVSEYISDVSQLLQRKEESLFRSVFSKIAKGSYAADVAYFAFPDQEHSVVKIGDMTISFPLPTERKFPDWEKVFFDVSTFTRIEFIAGDLALESRRKNKQVEKRRLKRSRNYSRLANEIIQFLKRNGRNTRKEFENGFIFHSELSEEGELFFLICPLVSNVHDDGRFQMKIPIVRDTDELRRGFMLKYEHVVEFFNTISPKQTVTFYFKRDTSRVLLETSDGCRCIMPKMYFYDEFFQEKNSENS